MCDSLAGSRKELDTGFQDTNESPSTIALAFYGALWAYDGWSVLYDCVMVAGGWVWVSN